MTTGVRRSPRTGWEWAVVAAILALAAWLRLRHLGIVMYHDDQAIALRIAHDIVHGDIRTVGYTTIARKQKTPASTASTA